MPYVPIGTQRTQTRLLRGHVTFTIQPLLRTTSHCDHIAPKVTFAPKVTPRAQVILALE
jgi:hypothetical protein